MFGWKAVSTIDIDKEKKKEPEEKFNPESDELSTLVELTDH